MQQDTRTIAANKPRVIIYWLTLLFILLYMLYYIYLLADPCIPGHIVCRRASQPCRGSRTRTPRRCRCIYGLY